MSATSRQTISPRRLHSILVEVAQRHRVPIRAILGAGGGRKVVCARWAAMQKLRSFRAANGEPRYSLPTIGRALNCDHTTVMHGLRRLDDGSIPYERTGVHRRQGVKSQQPRVPQARQMAGAGERA